MSESKMSKSTAFDVRDIYTIAGAKIAAIYEQNKMAVHFQGMSKTLQFPQTVALQGAPTCSIGISPYGLYNRLNDAGRLIMLNQKAVQFASAPFIRIGDQCMMLTQKKPGDAELPDDIPAVKNYYHPPIDEKNVSLTVATPSLEVAYKLGKVKITRRLISPLLSGGDQTLMPLGVEEFEVENAADEAQEITLVVPRPSLVNLQEKELKPTDQDSVYVCSAAVHGQKHEEFPVRGRPGRDHGKRGNPQPHGAGRSRNAWRRGGHPALFLPEPVHRGSPFERGRELLRKTGTGAFEAIMDQPSASPLPWSRKRPEKFRWPWFWTSRSRATLTERNSNANMSRTSRTKRRGRLTWQNSP